MPLMMGKTGGAAAPASWYTGLDIAYQPKGAASLAASYANLGSAGAANDASPGVAPTWAAGTGWIFNSSTQWLDTAWVPQNDQSQSVFIRYSGYATLDSGIFGQYDAEGRSFSILLGQSAQLVYARNGAYIAASTVVPAAANVGIAGNRFYLNGVAVGGTMSAWNGAAVLSAHVGNLHGLGGYFFVGNIVAVGISGAVLDQTAITSLVADMAAL